MYPKYSLPLLVSIAENETETHAGMAESGRRCKIPGSGVVFLNTLNAGNFKESNGYDPESSGTRFAKITKSLFPFTTRASGAGL
jgi:hypothetical protein